VTSVAPLSEPARGANEPTATPRRGFWRRRLGDPIIALLTQGITADKVSYTLALGTGLSLFPFLGFTSLLNLVVGLALRLNQPLLQTLNQLLGPVQLVLIVLYIRVGERIWGAEPLPFSIGVLVQTFRDASFTEFLQRFGMAGVHAFTAWLLTLPILVFSLNRLLRPVIRRVARRLPSASSSPESSVL
jgi:uncharacterized protein (DUF2062 family)